MDTAVWLSIELPSSFLEMFLTLSNPGSSGWIAILPLSFALSFLYCAYARFKDMDFSSLRLLLSPLASQLLVLLAGLARGAVPTPEWITIPFLVLQLAGLSWGVYKMPSSRSLAAHFGALWLAYAVYASLLAHMSFADIWL